jgi:hypothetical protein
MTTIIPIGVDCGIANILRKYNLRMFALPFDWNLTYGGVACIIEKDFTNFFPDSEDSMVRFIHDKFPEDREKYEKRILRLKTLLETSTEKVIFFRKGHAIHNHDEYDNVINDITEAERLDSIIKMKYPTLDYSIYVSLACGRCFDPKTIFQSSSSTIKIFNISSDIVDDGKFERLFPEIFT